MITKVQTVHFANNGTGALDVSCDITDDNGVPLKGFRSQFTASPALVAALLDECQAYVDAALGDVTDVVAATGLVKSIERLATVRAELTAEEAKLADLKAVAVRG